ncbi:MAG: hypothetical protein WC501_01240 [Candidatus Micrarchaeia archaeon]
MSNYSYKTSREIPIPDRSNRPHNSFSRIEPKIESAVKINAPDGTTITLSGKNDEDILAAIKNNGRIEKNTSTLYSNDGKEVVFEIGKDKTGREYVNKIIIEDKEYTNLQLYINGGFAIVKEVYLGIDQILLGSLDGKAIKLQDDSKRKDIEEDIDITKGRITQNQENVCLSCAGGRVDADLQTAKVMTFSLWHGTDPKEIKSNIQIEKIPKKNFVTHILRLQGNEIIFDKLQTDIDYSKLFDALNEEQKPKIKLIEDENQIALQQGHIKNPEKKEDSPLDIKLETQIHYSGIYLDNSVPMGLITEPADTAVKSKDLPNDSQNIKNLNIMNNFELEEENPIIRCIMDPAFRKIYGAMYGFVDGEEYRAQNISMERKTRNEPKNDKINNKGEKSEAPIKCVGEKNKKIETGKLNERGNTGKKEELKTFSSPRKRNQGEFKTKTEKNENKRSEKPPKIQPGKKEGPKPKTEKKPKLKKFETFLARELNLGKEKIQQFRIAMENLGKHMKNEIREFILKVEGFFKLHENIEKIKEKIKNHWVLVNTKIKLQKILIKLEFEVGKLKNEVQVLMNRTKENIMFFLSSFSRIKKLLLDKNAKILKKIRNIMLFFLLFRFLKKN